MVIHCHRQRALGSLRLAVGRAGSACSTRPPGSARLGCAPGVAAMHPILWGAPSTSEGRGCLGRRLLWPAAASADGCFGPASMHLAWQWVTVAPAEKKEAQAVVAAAQAPLSAGFAAVAVAAAARAAPAAAMFNLEA